jgi:hypothetical protein
MHDLWYVFGGVLIIVLFCISLLTCAYAVLKTNKCMHQTGNKLFLTWNLQNQSLISKFCVCCLNKLQYFFTSNFGTYILFISIIKSLLNTHYKIYISRSSLFTECLIIKLKSNFQTLEHPHSDNGNGMLQYTYWSHNKHLVGFPREHRENY